MQGTVHEGIRSVTLVRAIHIQREMLLLSQTRLGRAVRLEGSREERLRVRAGRSFLRHLDLLLLLRVEMRRAGARAPRAAAPARRGLAVVLAELQHELLLRTATLPLHVRRLLLLVMQLGLRAAHLLLLLSTELLRVSMSGRRRARARRCRWSRCRRGRVPLLGRVSGRRVRAVRHRR